MSTSSGATGLRRVALRTVLVSTLVTGAPFAVLARSSVISSTHTFTRNDRSLVIEGIAMIAARWPAAAVEAGGGDQPALDVAVKAALLYNFVKFAEWPTLLPGAPIVACIVGDNGIATAFVEIVGVNTIDDHRLVLGPSRDSATWRLCHLLFIADAEMRRSADGLAGITTLPVLTVSDTKGFAQAGGIIELYADAGLMRFVINVEAAERSGVLLSSRLLSLAKVIRHTRPERKTR